MTYRETLRADWLRCEQPGSRTYLHRTRTWRIVRADRRWAWRMHRWVIETGEANDGSTFPTLAKAMASLKALENEAKRFFSTPIASRYH